MPVNASGNTPDRAEFTSALDSAAEAAVLDDLFRHFQKQTVVCVTHSSAVARRFDRVVTLEKP